MSQVSAILRRGPAQYFHWCPACERMHPLPDGWLFVNANVNKPTFSPSFRQGLPDSSGRECHYVIIAGMIHFCGDSWHGRADIVPMPEIPAHEAKLA